MEGSRGREGGREGGNEVERKEEPIPYQFNLLWREFGIFLDAIQI